MDMHDQTLVTCIMKTQPAIVQINLSIIPEDLPFLLIPRCFENRALPSAPVDVKQDVDFRCLIGGLDSASRGKVWWF